MWIAMVGHSTPRRWRAVSIEAKQDMATDKIIYVEACYNEDVQAMFAEIWIQ